MKNRISLIKVFYVLSILMSALYLQAKTFNISINETKFSKKTDFSVPVLQNDQYIDFVPGNPMIPVQTHWFLLEPGQKIAKADITILSSDKRTLDMPLIPVQNQVPLSSEAELIREFISNDFPEKILYRTGNGYSGNQNIGYVSFYTGHYNAANKEYSGYRDIRIELTFENERIETFPDNLVSDDVTEMLTGIQPNRNTSLEYLLITRRRFVDDFQRLINWRQSQGYDARIVTIENIYFNSIGADLQEKIRNYIKQAVSTRNIDYITLAGDINDIPTRSAFAFDAHTSSEIANDIPCDMYYSCLNGDWNANGNDIFGEDDDNVDYFPDVYVSRISVSNSNEAENYITKMINYEKGEASRYDDAAGFSMELWSESNSESAQQYIYDRYFPDNYQVDFHYGDQNTLENAVSTISTGYNIIQHTGHANYNVLSLGNHNSIHTYDLDDIDNDFCGLFYSIGCWSAAIDKLSIGEEFVNIAGGFSGYIGNTRYGWGAPAAPAFGFSEFYQKAFFRNLFERDVRRIAQANALQKLDFIPYLSGISVYKWVAYELIALGDAAFKIYPDNPPELHVSTDYIGDQLHVYTTDGINPVSNCFTVHGYNSGYTAMDGVLNIPSSASSDSVTVYHEDYQYYSSEIFFIPDDIIYEINSDYIPEMYSQDSLSFNSTITSFNGGTTTFRIEYEYERNDINLRNTVFSVDVDSNEEVQLGEVTVSLTDNSNVKPGETICIEQVLYLGDTRILSKKYYILIKGSYVKCTQIQQDYNQNTMHFRVGVFGTESLTNLDINLTENNSIDFEQNQWNITNARSGDYFDFSVPFIIFNDATRYNRYIFFDFNFANSAESYTANQPVVLTDQENSVFEDFESLLSWQRDVAWEQVLTHSFSGSYSLSCRPQYTGFHVINTPSLTNNGNMEMSFQYKYKMPMYGTHGVFVTLETASRSDTLIFLGAGGALTREDEEYEIIESDWAEYRINLDDFLVNELPLGEIFNIKLGFNYTDSLDGFDYISDDENGIFIDNFQIGACPEIVSTDDYNENPDNAFNISFRNPSVIGSGDCKFSISAEKPLENISIYNIKGQKVRSWNKTDLNNSSTVYWNYRDRAFKKVANGVYFIKAESGNSVQIKKIIILK